jgi:hypothetical protein
LCASWIPTSRINTRFMQYEGDVGWPCTVWLLNLTNPPPDHHQPPPPVTTESRWWLKNGEYQSLSLLFLKLLSLYVMF